MWLNEFSLITIMAEKILGIISINVNALIILVTFLCLLGSAKLLTGNLRYLTVINVDRAINTQLIKNKYKAPKKYDKEPVANPNPAVQSGGIMAVAIATPGNTVPLFFFVISKMPAKPPNSAIRTSKIVGFVLDRSSVGFSSSSGDNKKYKNEAMILITTIISKLNADFFRKEVSLTPRLYPIAMIGPINGDINIAPIITGIELTFRPTDAITMAKAKI